MSGSKWVDNAGGQVKPVETVVLQDKNLIPPEEKNISSLIKVMQDTCFLKDVPLPNAIKLLNILKANVSGAGYSIRTIEETLETIEHVVVSKQKGDSGEMPIKKIGEYYFQKAREEVSRMRDEMFQKFSYGNDNKLLYQNKHKQLCLLGEALTNLEELGLISERKRNEVEKTRPAAERV